MSPRLGRLRLRRRAKLLAEFESPTPHGLVRDQDPALKEHFLDEAQAQRESEIKPNGIADDLGWEAMSLVVHGRQGHEASASVNRFRIR
jgi:hypothetical protein